MADLQAPANAHHQSQHHHLSRQPSRVQQVSDEVTLLSEHAESEDRPQHPRIGKRCRSRRCQDRCLQAITQGSQEGRGALRSPQANPEARSPAIARTEWGSRRVSSGGNSAEPTTNGEVVVLSRTGNSKNGDLNRRRTASPTQNRTPRVTDPLPASARGPYRAAQPSGCSTQ